MIHITVSGTEIYGKLDTKLTSGSVGRQVVFTFDADWEGLLKTVVFRVGSEYRSYYMEYGNMCEFPWELLTKDKVGQIIHIGVCGMRDNETVFPTMYTYIGELEEGADPSADPSVEHSPELVEQLISIAENAEDVAQSVRDDADAGKFNGKPGPQGPKGDTGPTVRSNWNDEDPNSLSGIDNKPAVKSGTGKDSIVLNSDSNIASGNSSHAQGYESEALSDSAHAEGLRTKATGKYSHSEGKNTTASGTASHAEGYETIASNDAAHSEGQYTEAKGKGSHAEGNNTIAASDYQHVQGRWNIKDAIGKFLHIVGNGTKTNRSNAHTLDWEGNAWFAGNVEANNLKLKKNDGEYQTFTAEELGKDIRTLSVKIGAIVSTFTAEDKALLEEIWKTKECKYCLLFPNNATTPTYYSPAKIYFSGNYISFTFAPDIYASSVGAYTVRVLFNTNGTVSQANTTSNTLPIPYEEIEAVNNRFEWKLLAEIVVEEPTTKLMADFGAPIENWYSETLIQLQAPINPDNTQYLRPNIQFGETEALATAQTNEGLGVIFGCQNNSYGGMPNTRNIYAAFLTQWINKEKAIYTDLRYTGFDAVCYAMNVYGCVNNTEGNSEWKIQGKRFMSLRGRGNDFTFPKGTILRIYGRG